VIIIVLSLLAFTTGLRAQEIDPYAAFLPGQLVLGSVQYRGSRQLTEGEGKYEHEISLTSPSRPARVIRWVDRAEGFWRAKVYGRDRLILLGTIAHLHTISVVDTQSGAPIAFVICRYPEFSPDGRTITFLQFRPRHEQIEEGDFVLALDLALNVEKQRIRTLQSAPEGWLEGALNWGALVYPSQYPIKRWRKDFVPTGIDVRARHWSRDGRRFYILTLEKQLPRLTEVVWNVGAPGFQYKRADLKLPPGLLLPYSGPLEIQESGGSTRLALKDVAGASHPVDVQLKVLR
jgi:hypothetical protein